jgi:hypothetical protein
MRLHAALVRAGGDSDQAEKARESAKKWREQCLGMLVLSLKAAQVRGIQIEVGAGEAWVFESARMAGGECASLVADVCRV